MSSFMPILQRMDRLDRLLQFLEEKHCLTSKHSSTSCNSLACKSSEVSELAQDRESYKSLSSAIEEVQCKGTLMERVAMLESRVLQLSLEMELESASSSSCSTILVSDQKFEQDNQDPQMNVEYESPKACVKKPKRMWKDGKRRGRRTSIVTIIQSREWLKWPRMGC